MSWNRPPPGFSVPVFALSVPFWLGGALMFVCPATGAAILFRVEAWTAGVRIWYTGFAKG